MTRTALAALALLLWLASPSLAGYPEKPVTLVAPFPEGGPVDVAARALAEAAKAHFPQPLEVVNRPGGAGTVGTAEVVTATADGYTLGIGASGVMTIQPHLTPLPFGSPEGYTPLLGLVNNPVCLAVKGDAPWTGAVEFLVYARAHPDKARVGDVGAGSVLHLATEQLSASAGVKLTAVHFTGGPESLEALADGQVAALSQHHPLVRPQVEAGQVRVLAVYEEQRSPLFPDAPTMKELGYDLSYGAYLFLMGPPGMPEAVRSAILNGIGKAAADPAFVNAMRSKGFELMPMGPEELTMRLARDYEANGRLARSAGLKKE